MKDNVYLDNAATSWPKPEPVHAFADRFARARGVNPGRGGHAMAADADRMVMQARRLLAACFGFSGGAARTVFAHNGTDALGTAIRGLARAGDRLLTTRLEHNAVARTLAHLERDAGVTVERVAADADGYVSADAIARALDAGSPARALVVNHASNVIGTVQPLAGIAAVARERGVPLVVDAAQTAGVVPIDVDALGIAALACPGHKGLLGPTGSGVLIVAPGTELVPSRTGGTGVDSASIYQPEAYPFRLEAGTLGLPGIAGLHAAQRWLHALGAHVETDPGAVPAFVPDEAVGVAGVPEGAPDPSGIGPRGEGVDELLDAVDAIDPAVHARRTRAAMARIHAVELAHLARIETELARYPSVRVLGGARAGMRVATLSFAVRDRDAAEIAERLDADFGVCSRAGLQCAPAVHEGLGTLEAGGTVRLSPGWYTDEEDLARLFEGLAEVL